MTNPESFWKVRLARAAVTDFDGIVEWTADRFGDTQADVYRQTLLEALAALADGPDITGVKPLNHAMPGLLSLHVARNGRRGRHVLLFRVEAVRKRKIEVLRILHDAMDFTRHLPKSGK